MAYCLLEDLRETLCHGTLQVSGIHQNTSCVICCVTTRPKLVINVLCKDKRIVNEQLLPILIFHFLQLVHLYALISRRFSAEYYRSISLRSTISSNSSENRTKQQQQIYKNNSDKKIGFLLNSTSCNF